MVAAASKGIGFATARMLAAEGCHISICGRTQASLDEAAAAIGGGVVTTVADVSVASDLERWVEITRETLGPPDILVTNTGGPPAGPVGEITDEQWQAGIDSTLLNVVRLYRLVAPYMAERGWGRIVHITSLVAKEPSSMLPISSTLRAGLMALTRLQADEVAARGVTVNCVLPGHTLTDRQRHLAAIRADREKVDEDEALRRQAADLPIGRLAEPDEIAAAIVFLCSAPASYITGVNLLVDGGAIKGPG